jgi:hypothetical protein
MTQSMEPYKPKEIAPAVETFSTELGTYLETLGLPKDNVLVKIGERKSVINNMPTVVGDLTGEQCQAAMYISKFVAAAVVGLFDAALNYLWDETIRNLRQKVAKFDLEYFYDSVITDQDRRAKLKTDVDLEKLDDWELIRGCRATGIITEMGFRHLDYIRDMRNWASAAHPNQNELSGLQIVTWLQTCIREVLCKEPSGLVIEVRKLLSNLRKEQLSAADIPPIRAALPELPEDLSASLLRAVLGMYTDVKLPADVRNNIKLVAPDIWRVCSEEPRYEVGLKFATLEANGEISRAKLAREFLDLVDGLPYLPGSRLELEISTALDALMSAHNGYNNFYNEPGPARQLQRLIPPSGEVSANVIKRYVKTVVMCKIGNGSGICWAAEPTYDDLISRFSDKFIFWFADLPLDAEFSSRLLLGKCADRYLAVASSLYMKVVNAQLKQVLQFILNMPANKLHNLGTQSQFQQLLKAALAVRKVG